jgi:CheY-like chemotaxis protein
VPTPTSTNPERVLLVDLSERERHELQEQLLAAGFEVMIALSHVDACLRLLTWRPDGIIADGDLATTQVGDLADIIRTSAPVPASLLLLCTCPPLQEVPAALLLKPVAFPELLSALRRNLADRDDVQVAGGWAAPNED